MLYKKIFRRFLFVLDPEFSHEFVLKFFKLLCFIPGFLQVLRFFYLVKNPKLERKLFGLSFKTPIGLAAGFDKNAKYYNELASLGFGFVEIGTVTPLPQSGNMKPRLFRLQEDYALINRMGFNNDGVDVIVQRLRNKYTDIIIGGNIGKNKVTPNANANNDYINCFHKIAPHVDYLVLNVSSPNTPNLTELQNKTYLNRLLLDIQKINKNKYDKPVLIKISPDLSFERIDEVLQLIEQHNIAGIITTNTSSNRDGLINAKEEIQEHGGLSGKPLKNKSKEIVAYVSNKTKGRLPIIAVGGIINSHDAIEMFNAGASLVQIYTGLVYNGPSIVRDMNKHILET